MIILISLFLAVLLSLIMDKFGMQIIYMDTYHSFERIVEQNVIISKLPYLTRTGLIVTILITIVIYVSWLADDIIG